MREKVDNIIKVFRQAEIYLVNLIMAVMSVFGFMFGSLALSFILIEKGVSISIIIFSFKIISVFLLAGLLLIGLHFYFWLIKKFLVPLAEKQREKRQKEFEEKLMSKIKETVGELNNKQKKK